MRAILLSLVPILMAGMAGCGPAGMRASAVDSVEYRGIAEGGPRESWDAGVPDSPPDSHRQSDRSALPQSPEAPAGPELPDVSEAPEVPAGPDLPEVAKAPESPATPEGSQVPKRPELPDVSNAPELPAAPETTQDPKGRDGSGASNPDSKPNDFQSAGSLIPSIYYQPLIVDNDEVCSRKEREPMLGEKGVALIQVCPQTLAKCSMEGSCRISQKGIVRSFNSLGGRASFRTFFEVDKNVCSFGFGVNAICLDPFYTVAADLRYHRAGEVIYVPALAGRTLPNGERHTGFLIVRDRGGRIQGPNRFDFFSGSMSWEDPENPFRRLRLSDQSTRLLYYKVGGNSAKQILSGRGFPRLPSRSL